MGNVGIWIAFDGNWVGPGAFTLVVAGFADEFLRDGGFDMVEFIAAPRRSLSPVDMSISDEALTFAGEFGATDVEARHGAGSNVPCARLPWAGEVCGHDWMHSMPFAAQPRIHNPSRGDDSR